jgi:hypothetical protein
VVSGFPLWRFVRSLVLAALLLTAPAAADDAISEEAKLYFKNGVELIQNQPPNYQDAYYQFKLAWEKSKSWKVLSNWGVCALKLERDGEAIWAYTEYLKQSGKDIDPDERKDLERDLLLLNGNAASVTVTSDVADLELVDARAGSAVPPQTYRLEAGRLALRLRAGSHTLSASHQGKSLRWEVTLSPGRTEEHRFEFTAPAGVAATPAPAPAAAPPITSTNAGTDKDVVKQSGGTVRKVGYVVTGAGLLALGGGAFFGSQAKQDEKRLRERCRDLPDSGYSCPKNSEDAFDAAIDKANMANVLMIAGGVVAAGGVAMIIWGGPKKSTAGTTASFQLSPVLGPHDAGIFAQGSF